MIGKLTNDECGHQWSERSQLAVGSDCELCGEPAEVVGIDDDPPTGLNTVSSRQQKERAHPGYAREKAREVLRQRQRKSGIAQL